MGACACAAARTVCIVVLLAIAGLALGVLIGDYTLPPESLTAGAVGLLWAQQIDQRTDAFRTCRVRRQMNGHAGPTFLTSGRAGFVRGA